ncbi:hypothetical protein [uncultured Sphingomonas sp.]|uniref:hypothetical protein n=1 Tax=uncultured Sphingomonas sp. TaxID=158754 RepID=UPI0035CAB29F
MPDADLFGAITTGRASVETATIERFTSTGIRLASGRDLPADIIVTATGLELQLLSGVAFTLDGAPVDLAKTLHYKGMMYEGVPNMASVFGYTNASWTLKTDLTAMYVCRLLNTMTRRGLRQRRRATTIRRWGPSRSSISRRAMSGAPPANCRDRDQKNLGS